MRQGCSFIILHMDMQLPQQGLRSGLPFPMLALGAFAESQVYIGRGVNTWFSVLFHCFIPVFNVLIAMLFWAPELCAHFRVWQWKASCVAPFTISSGSLRVLWLCLCDFFSFFLNSIYLLSVNASKFLYTNMHAIGMCEITAWLAGSRNQTRVHRPGGKHLYSLEPSSQL